MGHPAVFLDRDGVLTVPIFRGGRSFAALDLSDFAFYPDAADAVRKLKQAGFLVIVATNQPDITTGKLAPDVLDQMHQRLRTAMQVDAIEIATATRAAPDRRRKPAPGMLVDAAVRFDIDLSASYMVGDRASDIECGMAAGCRTVFIDLGYTDAEEVATGQDKTVANLGEAADWICSERKIAAGQNT